MARPARNKPWAPPSRLATPTAPPGFKYRWVRYTIKGDDDTINVMGRERQNYEAVRSEELNDSDRPQFQALTQGRMAGVVVVGDLMLMKVPVETVEQRTDYYADRTSGLMQAVEQALDKQNSRLAPISRDRASSTTIGGKPVEFR